MSFGVGDLVECVNDKWTSHHLLPGVVLPVRGGIYTVRELDRDDQGQGILLCEIINPAFKFRDGLAEPAFSVHRFRPIRKPSIEIFRQIVADVRDGQKVGA